MIASLRCLGVSLVLAAVAGCVEPGPRYGRPGDLNFGSSDSLTASERLYMAKEATEKIKIDPSFSEYYQQKRKELAAKGVPRPVLAVCEFENNTGVGNDGVMESVATEFQNQLRKSGLFSVVKDVYTKRLMSRILRSDLGENGETLQEIGTYSTPNYLLYGELRKERDGDGYMFSLNVTMLDTKTRQIFWSDVVRLVKKDK